MAWDDEWYDDFFLEFETSDGPVKDEDDDSEEYTVDDNNDAGASNEPAPATTSTPDAPPPDDEDDSEEYSVDDNEGETEQPPAETSNAPDAPPPEDNDEGEEYSMDDEGSDTGETQSTTGEQPTTTSTPDAPPDDNDEGEEYSMDDEGGEGEQPQQISNTPDAPPPDDDDEGEDYEIPEDGEGGESEGETQQADGQEGQEQQGDQTQSSDGSVNNKLQELENVIFDNLTEPEKKLKIQELKELYINVYNKCTTITDMMSEIKRDEATIQIVEYISNTLLDLKQYVNDYINDIFDTKTYVENLSQLQKYIMVFNAINKVLAQIKAENE